MAWENVTHVDAMPARAVKPKVVRIREATRAGDHGARLHFHRRGYEAWKASPADHPVLRGPGGVNPLLVHKVTDATGLSYCKAVRRFLVWCRLFDAPMATDSDKADSLTDYLAYLAYGERTYVGEGRLALFGVEYIFPELGPQTQARTALRSWDKMVVAGEGTPVPWVLVALIADALREAGEHEAADIVILSADMYLRESDWSMLRAGDVVNANGLVAIMLGVAERGEMAKTGPRQGVRPDYPLTAQILLERAAALRPDDLLFKITPAQFRAVFLAICVVLGIDVGPPHNLRHAGPSADAAYGYRTLDEIRTRGRWRAKTSVLRYMKSHTLIAAEARVPADLRARGELLLSMLGERAAVAIR